MSIFGSSVFKHGGVRSGSPVISASQNTALGDLLVVFVGWSDDGTVTIVQDSAGNTYVPGAQRTLGTAEDAGFGQFWYCLGATHASATNVVEAILSDPTGNNFAVINVWDVPLSGGVALFDVDVNTGGSGNGTTAAFSTAGLDEFLALAALDGFGTDSYAAAGLTFDGDGTTFGAGAHTTYASPQSSITVAFSTHPSVAFAMALGIKAGPSTFTISGSVGVAGVTVKYSGAASGSVTSGAGGTYSISGLSNGTYTITPSLAGYVFSPGSKIEVVAGSNISGVNFTSTKISTRSK
jgi:hypothetical protein